MAKLNNFNRQFYKRIKFYHFSTYFDTLEDLLENLLE